MISESLSCLFNLSIKNKIFANEWKSPKVTPLYKNEGKRSDMTNYSLISIIPVAGKKIDQNLNWDDDIQMISKNLRLLQASVQLSTSETLSLVTILSCSCTCKASLQLQFGGPLPEAAKTTKPCCSYNHNIKL